MGSLTAGEVVLVRFPFSDLSQSKLRPALVVADAGRGDWLLCQITSKSYADPAALMLDQADFTSGSLHVTSYARPLKLFTAHETLIASQIGTLTETAHERICSALVAAIVQSRKPRSN